MHQAIKRNRPPVITCLCPAVEIPAASSNDRQQVWSVLDALSRDANIKASATQARSRTHRLPICIVCQGLRSVQQK